MKNKDVRKALRLMKSRNRLKRLQAPRILKDNYDDEAANLMIDALKADPDFGVFLEMLSTVRHWLENGYRPENVAANLIMVYTRFPGTCTAIDVLKTLACVTDDPAAVAFIRSCLKSRDDRIVNFAVWTLAELHVYYDDLVPLLGIRNDSVRNAAIRALSKTADPDAVPLLCRLLRETPHEDTEQAVMQVLTEINRRHLDTHPDALPLYERDTQTQIIEDALCDDITLNMRAFDAAKDFRMLNHPDIIRGMILALGNPQADAAHLGRLLRQTDRSIAIRMSRDYYGYGTKGMINSGALFGLSKDTPDGKTLVGAAALMCLREGDGQETLLTNLHYYSVFHRVGFTRLLAAGDSDAVRHLIHLLTHDEDAAVRVAAAQSLGDIGDASAIKTLTHAAIRPRCAALRDSAYTALKKISRQSPANAAAVLACVSAQLNSTEKNDIKNAARLLVYFGGERAIPLLIQLLHKVGHEYACAAAIRALSQISHPTIPALMTRILHDNRPHITAALKKLHANNAVNAAELTARLAPKKAPATGAKTPTVPELLKQFGDTLIAPEQMWIIDAIAKTGGTSAIAPLMSLCTSACTAPYYYITQAIAALCEDDWKNTEMTPQDERTYWLVRSLYSTDHKAHRDALKKLGRWDDPYIVYHVLQLGRRDHQEDTAAAVIATLRNITAFREKYHLEPTAEHSKGENHD